MSFEETIIYHCAATLAGIKTGSMYSYRYSCIDEMREDVRRFNRQFSRRGICLVPLCYSDGRALLYMYRPDYLERDLRRKETAAILKSFGYPESANCRRCVSVLTSRVRGLSEFPHEIGLFLSYPPEDVKGFIDNHARGYKTAGLWKVYGDEKKAGELFGKYKRCRDNYYSRWKAGCGLSQLTVTA